MYDMYECMYAKTNENLTDLFNERDKQLVKGELVELST